MSEPVNPAEFQSSASPSAFPIVPEHELIRLIGSGSSGQVWLAKNSMGFFRAVKIVYESSFRHRRPFDREFAGILNFEPVSRLHQGLVDILQVGRNDTFGYFYCVMELADDVATGREVNPDDYHPRTLMHDVTTHKRLPVARCLEIGREIASALEFLHRNGLTHRDVKPSNIVFVNGSPKLADIGLVAEMSEGRTSYVGTEGFIPPEGPGSAQADVYALGKVLYEISTGKDRYDYPELPDEIQNFAEWSDLVQFNKIVVKACRANINQRFRSAQALLDALQAFQFCHVDPEKEKQRRKLQKLIGIIGGLLGAGIIAGMIWRLVWLLDHGR